MYTPSPNLKSCSFHGKTKHGIDPSYTSPELTRSSNGIRTDKAAEYQFLKPSDQLFRAALKATG